MADEKNYMDAEENIIVREDYGFKTNIKQKVNDVIVRIDALDKANINFSITVSRALALAGVAVLVVGATIIFLFNDLARGLFLLPWLILLDVGIIGITALYALVDPAYGSLLKTGYTLFEQKLKQWNVDNGRLKKTRYSGFHNVRNDATIEMFDGDFGKMFHIDGTTSATAYPSEILRQEQRAMKYHNGRNRTTTEIHITSSQKQNADLQIKDHESRIRLETNPAKLAILEMDHRYLSNHVNGVKPTVVQYLILRDSSERYLDESVERLERFVRQGFYYSMRPLDRDETEEILSDILSLK